MSMNELTAKIKELRELQALIEEAQAEAEEVRAGEYKLTYKTVTSTRLDTKALTAALPEVAQRFSKTTTTRRFCVA